MMNDVFPIAVTYIRSSVLDFLKRRFSNPGILVVYFQVGEVSQCIKIWSDRCLEDAIVTHLGWHLLRTRQVFFCLVGLTLNGGLVRETPSPKVAFRFCLYPRFHPYHY